MRITELAQRNKQFGGRFVKSAFALNGLYDDSGNTFGIDICLEQKCQGLEAVCNGDTVMWNWEGYVINVARHGAELLLVWQHFSSECHGQHGAAMKAASEGNDSRALSGGAGNLHSILCGFSAGGEEYCFGWSLEWCKRVQAFSQFHVRLI